MDPYTVFDAAGAYREFILTLPEFYFTGSSLFLGAALAVLTLRSPSTPKGKERLRARKGWAVPFLLTAAVGFSLWGFFRIGLPSPEPALLWGIPAITAVAFLALRFPRVMGIPLGAAFLGFAICLSLVLTPWQPLRPGTALAAARSMPEEHWELIHVEGSSLIPDEMFPETLWVLETGGYLQLSGAGRWISWKNPQSGGLGEALHGIFQALGLEKGLRLEKPPAPRVFFPSSLVLSPQGELAWEPGI